MAKKVLFIASNHKITTGSFRIWVKDYNSYFEKLGIPSKITNKPRDSEIKDCDIIILGKGRYQNGRTFWNIKNAHPDKIIGAITPPPDLNLPFDFAMAGSLEEADSLSFHKNVIINAHIESMYLNSKKKVHEKKELLKICFHGWTHHLASFGPNLKYALEEFEKEQNIELFIVSEKESPNWITGRPNIKNIKTKLWDFDSIKSDIQNCDIGIIPGIHDATDKLDSVDERNGKFKTDYLFRFKNKCNNGRCLVFFQLGVPVIADFSPSHGHLLGTGDCGFMAHSKSGWLHALRKLKNHKTREEVSNNAYNKVKLEYNPIIWAQKYYNTLCEIHEKNTIHTT
tara:strand:+ start:54 stop:1073 length:1020 start_codon:yes stop_codon:yes gene_type:complete